MKINRVKISWLPAALLTALPALGQGSASSFRLEEPKAESPNRISAAYRMSFNLNVDFRNLGAFTARTQPGPASGGMLDRTYDDGYNRVDITGNNHGPGFQNTTWNWGYDNASQIVPNAANPQGVVMHSYSSAGISANNRNDDPEPGFEIAYNRELFRKKAWRLGFEAAFGYTDLSIGDAAPLAGGINQLSDTFSVPAEFSGQPLPPAGYRGSRTGVPEGSNPVISSIPTRSMQVLPGLVTGSRTFGADLFNLRLGPYLEFPLTSKLAVNLSGGFALVYAHSDFNFSETLTGAGIGSLSFSGANSHEDWLPGGYVAGGFSAEFAKDWKAFAGAQFEDVGKYTHTSNVGGRQAVLDLSRAVFVTVGLSFSF